MAREQAQTLPIPPPRSSESKKVSEFRQSLVRVWNFRVYYLLALPGILYFVIFHYVPMIGIVIGFKDISPWGGMQGIIDAPWVGFKHFDRFFSSIFFWDVVENLSLIHI